MASIQGFRWAQEQVDMWAANTYPVYQGVRSMYYDGESDAAIADYMQTQIRSGVGDSFGWIVKGDTDAEQYAIGDADGVTFDDIDWADIIDSITDRKAGQ